MKIKAWNTAYVLIQMTVVSMLLYGTRRANVDV